MGSARVMRRFAAPASAVWDFVSWRGMVKLAGGSLFERVEFQGDTHVGATKTLYIGDALPIRERLESLDESGMSYSYRIIDNGPLPVTNYLGQLRLTPCGPKACVIVIENDFVGVDIDEAEWARTWQGMENRLLDEIEARVAAALT